MKILTFLISQFYALVFFLICPKRNVHSSLKLYHSEKNPNTKINNNKSKIPKKFSKKKKKTEKSHCKIIDLEKEALIPQFSFKIEEDIPSLKTYIIHEKISLKFRNICLHGKGKIYNSPIFQIIFQARLKHDLSTLKLRFYVFNMAKHTELSSIKLFLKKNPDLNVIERIGDKRKGLDLNDKRCITLEIKYDKIPFQSSVAVLKSQCGKLSFSITFFIPLTILNFIKHSREYGDYPKPLDFWKRLKKIKYSDDWFDFDERILKNIQTREKLLQLFKSSFHLKNTWLHGNGYEIYGVFWFNDMEFYYHIELIAEHRKMKIFVGSLDKELSGDDDKNMNLLEHVYETFYYLFVKNRDNDIE